MSQHVDPTALMPEQDAGKDRRGSRRRRTQALRGSDRGMTTAEYAIGTVAACGFGGVLYKVVTSDQVANLISDVIERALTMTF